MSNNYRQKYESCEARRRFAWGKYFQIIDERRDDAEIIVRTLELSLGQELKANNNDIVLPPHITREFYDMGVKLKRDFTCPICMEIPNKENFEITMCGHTYCKECLKTIKESNNPKCALCRKDF